MQAGPGQRSGGRYPVDVFGNHPGPRENIARGRPARHLFDPLAGAVVGVGGAGAPALGFDAIFSVVGVGVQGVVGHVAGSVVGEAASGNPVGGGAPRREGRSIVLPVICLISLRSESEGLGTGRSLRSL